LIDDKAGQIGQAKNRFGDSSSKVIFADNELLERDETGQVGKTFVKRVVGHIELFQRSKIGQNCWQSSLQFIHINSNALQ